MSTVSPASRVAATLVLLALTCAACSEPAPTTEPRPDLALAANPGYVTPTSWRQECLGRQVFDVPGEIEWGLANPKTPYYASTELGPKLRVKGDIWHYGFSDGDPDSVPYIDVSITPRGSKEMFERAKLHEEVDILNALSSYKQRLETKKRIFLRARAGESDFTPEDADKLEAEIKDIESSMAELPTYLDYPLGLPDSYTRVRRGFVTYLWRDQRVIRFEIFHKTMPIGELKRNLLDIVSRFRLRAPHEIPKEKGVCLPHGFIADNGLTYYDIQNTFRLKAVPNVTYTLHVGDPLPSTEPFAFDIWADQLIPPGIIGVIAKQQTTRRFRPDYVTIGAMQGLGGGYALRYDLQGKETEEVYTFRAGYHGWRNPKADDPEGNRFPFVNFILNSYPQSLDPAFKTPAPPVEEAREQWLQIMKSVRWREQ